MIKNTYIKCALVLSCICVVSAGLIGGLNTLATSYKATHRSTETPSSVKALKEGATFVEVTDDIPKAVISNSTKVTFESIYALQEEGKTTGYAYIVNCSKVKSSDIELSVLYEGAASTATKTAVKPSAINLISGGDTSYDVNVLTLAEEIPNGTATMNDYTNVVTGGTWSQKFFIDGLQVTRDDYVVRINSAFTVQDVGE